MEGKSNKKISKIQQPIDPYYLISILNKKLKSQTDMIEWFKKMYETAEYQKKITINELKRKKIQIENLKIQFNTEMQLRKDTQLELDQLKNKLQNIQRINTNRLLDANLTDKIYNQSNESLSSKNTNKNYLSALINPKKFQQKPIRPRLVLQLKQNSAYNILNPQSKADVLEEKNVNNLLHQFIPFDIKLVQRSQRFSGTNTSQKFLNGQILSQSIEEPNNQKSAQFFCEDFLVLGPDLSDLRKKRDQNRSAEELDVKPGVLYLGNGKNQNQHVYTQIAMRCFPFGAKVKRQFVESYRQLKDVIQFMPNNKLSKDCLILNLKGQPSQTARNSRCFKRSNLNQIQFVICVKVQEFVWLTKDQRHYQRSEHQIWLVDKYYAIVSYYPIIDVHLNLINKIHNAMMQQKLPKILVEKENFYSFDLKKNVSSLEKNSDIKEIIDYFKSYKPELGDIIFFKTHYYGTIPCEGEAEYYLAKLTAPIFMTIFSLEEMLLLLIGIFCEKSISLISKDEGIASLCAMFLINVLIPFPYSFSVLLNVDEQKMSPFVFQYPFPMISTIKKTEENLHSILELYARAKIEKKGIKEESQKMILVDIDTNSIFYQGHQTFEPLIAMSRPTDDFIKEYANVNASYSKSYSFPKKMDQKKESEQVNKRAQQRNKIIEDMQHTIKNHITKVPSFEYTPQIHKTLLMLHKYVRSFVVDGRDLAEALEQLPQNKYHEVLRRSLLERHPSKAELVEKIINSQFYADYLNLFAE